MAIVRRIGPSSAFKIVLITYALIGVVMAAIFCLAAYIRPTPLPGGLGPALFLIIFPVAYGVLGGVVALVAAALYNLVARWVGGLEVDLS